MWVGSITALPIALPLRAMVSTTTPVARPVSPLNIAHVTAPAIDQRHPARPVGVLGDRHLQRECGDRHEGDEAEHLGVVEVELVADVRQQDAEGGAVELVDGVEAEQHHQWERRLASADVAQPFTGVAAGSQELDASRCRLHGYGLGGSTFASAVAGR